MQGKIFVVSHKDFKVPPQKEYVPIYVGPSQLSAKREYYRDKDLINIAHKNPNYCELTALYWIWKNVKDLAYIGFVHYRRYFFKSFLSRNYNNLLNEQQIINLLKTYDIIVPKQNISTLTIREEYSCDGSGLQKDLEVLENVIGEFYPEYLKDLKEVLNGHRSYLFNMMICKPKILNDYCEWLFNILEEVERRIDISEYSVQQARIFGYMSERLLTVFIRFHRLKVKEVCVMNTETTYINELSREIKRNLKKVKY